ncbi:MAG: exosortase-associated EpsI family protein [Archaeoglobaceae archaeon]
MPDVRSTFLMMLGIILFSGALLVVLAPETIADYTVIDTAFHRTDHRLIGKTAYNFNNISQIKEFPREIGGWTGMDYRYSQNVYEALEADILFSRAYSKGNIIWMDIINSESRKSFHDPKVCYGGQWNIVNESVVEIPMNSSQAIFDQIYVNKLDLERKDGNEDLVVLYWFIFRGGESVTMVRLSSPSEDYSATYDYMEDFVKDVMNLMYEKVREPRTVGEVWIKQYGIGGYAGIVLLFLPSVILIGWGIRMK